MADGFITSKEPAQAGRGNEVRLQTAARSRPCLQPDGLTENPSRAVNDRWLWQADLDWPRAFEQPKAYRGNHQQTLDDPDDNRDSMPPAELGCQVEGSCPDGNQNPYASDRGEHHSL